MGTINSIKVRMYRHGFGDCFLLRFFSGDTLQYKMLIDCGIKKNDKVPGITLGDVAADIQKETTEKIGNKDVARLDVLVATHEHHDHVSGFHPSLALYDKFQFDKIWMAWTEDPEDDEAKQINAYLRTSMAALVTASKKMKDKAKKDNETGMYAGFYRGAELLGIREKFNEALANLVDFQGNIAVTKTSASGISYKDGYSISMETMEAFDHIKTKLAKDKSGISYFEPGKLIENIEALAGIRIYVLGPPKSNMLNKETPSGGAKKEVYFSQSSNSMMGFVRGVLNSAGLNNGVDDGQPFSHAPTIPVAQAKKDPWFRSNYFKTENDWRSVEDDWLDMAGSLALQMDSDTNNTSLVMAIEFIASGKVLLFPGDAQVGSWLSWHDLEWQVMKNGSKQKMTATDLLNNTVFYKVAHHSSHNATLKEGGLELMTHDELVAFVPEKEKQYKGIPYAPLLKRLEEKTKGRLLVSADADYPAEKKLKTKPSMLSEKEWNDFTNNIVCTPLYIEYTIKEN